MRLLHCCWAALPVVVGLIGGALHASFDIPWSTVDGGGGTATAGDWSITGHVGQCDTGALSGDQWTFEGGFWSALVVAACAGDVDRNGDVDAADIAVLLGAWGPVVQPTASDLDGNGVVDAADLAVVLGAWGPC